MKTKFYTEGVDLIAENDAEIALLAQLDIAINSNNDLSVNPAFPSLLLDNLEGGVENRVINGILEISER